MIKKSNLLAIVATAALGLAMLSATEASARGHGGGGGGMHGGGGHHGGGHIGHIGGRGDGGGRHVHHHHHRHPHWHVRYHRPVWYGVRTVGYTYGATRVAGPCTCLSKEYTPDGRVLFKDLCTNEAAINPPVAPQQSSSIDAPVQQASAQPTGQYQTAPANAMPQVDPQTGQPK